MKLFHSVNPAQIPGLDLIKKTKMTEIDRLSFFELLKEFDFYNAKLRD